MRHAARGIVLFGLVLLSGCGAGTVFESVEQRQARIETAVRDAMERERGWQSRLVERRTEAVRSGQRALAERMAGLEGMAAAIASRLDAIDQAAPQDRLEPASAEKQVALAAEVSSIQRDIAALAAAVSRVSVAGRNDEAAVRARLERLELRTSKLAWPAPSSDVKAVHLASYRSHEAALAGWETLVGRYHGVLDGETPTLVEVRTVAGEYVRLFTGAGLDDRGLLAIREALRDGGDYAMILPLPGNAGS